MLRKSLKPTEAWEIYATKDFSKDVHKILDLLGLQCPNAYETADTLRRKLKLYNSVKDLFNFSTTVV